MIAKEEPAPQAGYVISAYALGVVVGAPLIAIAGAKSSRRSLLLILMMVFALGNLASALAPDFLSFIVLRFLSGLPHGAYFGVSALVAASLVPLHMRARAVGYVMLGLTGATLAGTPVMALFGQYLNWRVMFLAVGLIGALTVTLIWFYLPRDKPAEGASVMRELVAFTHPQALLTLALAATGFGGMFAVFSYIASTATEVAHLSSVKIPVIMALFGVGMNVGNVLGAWLGGLVIAFGYGYAATGYVGAFLSSLGLFVFAASLLLERRSQRVGVPACGGLYTGNRHCNLPSRKVPALRS
jgi:DHA1 family inner membrane transport protein